MHDAGTRARQAWRAFTRLLAWPLIGLVKVYRLFLSPFVGQHCRFTPTCSVYAIEALQVHGAIKGSWLAAHRISRCHPWCAGGYDPVPPATDAAPGESASSSESAAPRDDPSRRE